MINNRFWRIRMLHKYYHIAHIEGYLNLHNMSYSHSYLRIMSPPEIQLYRLGIHLLINMYSIYLHILHTLESLYSHNIDLDMSSNRLSLGLSNNLWYKLDKPLHLSRLSKGKHKFHMLHQLEQHKCRWDSLSSIAFLHHIDSILDCNYKHNRHLECINY